MLTIDDYYYMGFCVQKWERRNQNELLDLNCNCMGLWNLLTVSKTAEFHLRSTFIHRMYFTIHTHCFLKKFIVYSPIGCLVFGFCLFICFDFGGKSGYEMEYLCGRCVCHALDSRLEQAIVHVYVRFRREKKGEK